MKLEEGKIKLVGCMISENSPQYQCNNCGESWTLFEVIDAVYNEIIDLRASIGGYCEGYYGY